MEIKKVYFDSERDFVKESANFILAEAMSCVKDKAFFTISLTGGSSPIEIYKMLNQRLYSEKFPWDKTYFFIGDERILPAENVNSNAFMINKTLFANEKVRSDKIIFPNITLTNPLDIARDYEIRIKDFFKSNQPSFDLVLLGMGLDCHTASLFPGDSSWKNNNSLVVSTSMPAGVPEVYRVSMGIPLINASKKILMLISKDNKRAVAEKLLNNLQRGKNPYNSPIAEINLNGEFVWHISPS